MTKGNRFLYQLESSLFLVSFVILLEILSSMRGLTCKLQMRAVDVLYAHKEVKKVISTFENMRKNSEQDFRRIFKRASKLGKDLNGEEFELSTPRINKRQMYRDNPIQGTTAEQHYRFTLFNEFLSHVISELQQRFSDSPFCGLGLLHLLPSQCCKSDEHPDSSSKGGNELVIPESLVQAVNFYQNDIPHEVMFSTEYLVWVNKWRDSENDAPTKLVGLWKTCDKTSFPNIYILLQLCLIFPITSCESERSFSQLKLIKSYRCSTMTEERLSGLALMKINRKYCEKVCNSPQKMRMLVQ